AKELHMRRTLHTLCRLGGVSVLDMRQYQLLSSTSYDVMLDCDSEGCPTMLTISTDYGKNSTLNMWSDTVDGNDAFRYQWTSGVTHQYRRFPIFVASRCGASPKVPWYLTPPSDGPVHVRGFLGEHFKPVINETTGIIELDKSTHIQGRLMVHIIMRFVYLSRRRIPIISPNI